MRDCPHCKSDNTERYDMQYHGEYIEFYHECNSCGTEWTVSYGLCDPNVDIISRGCDSDTERDPDEKYEQQNDK